MALMDAERSERIAELEALIKRHQHLYYNAQPEISDDDFDALWNELEDLDPENALLAGIGIDAADGWPKARHIMPMGSQAKATDPEAFTAWAEKVGHEVFLVQYKLDGASIELQYRAGRLSKALTRGDGTVGDDITPNAVKMRGVPALLPVAYTGAVRGEVLMSHAVHASRHSEKANCRNAANGLMKRKDGVGAQDLDVICYDAVGAVPATAAEGNLPEGRSGEMRQPFADEAEKLEWLRENGFQTVETVLLHGAEEVIEYRAGMMDRRDALPFDIDGLVVKGLAIDTEDMARSRPELQIAFKFSPEEAVTTILAVEWSESGANFTPIGVMDPVRLAGTTVQRANLCNPDMLRTLDLRVGSRVVITKRGEIIPKIESLVSNPEASEPLTIPSVCSCGSTLVDEGSRLYCPNPACPKKALHRLEKWLSVVDVRDFGSVILGKLQASGRVRRIADLYTLEETELSGYERMGGTLARKILRNLRARTEIGLPEFIGGFDIEGVGVLSAEKLVAAGFDTLEKLFAATIDELDRAEGVAEITARAVAEGLAALRPEMEALLSTGAIRIKPPLPAAFGLAGKSFCFTGELTSLKRSEAERRVRDSGGTVKSSVTRDLDYLVTNDPGSGSDKNRKAKAYGVTILDEAAFLALPGLAALSGPTPATPATPAPPSLPATSAPPVREPADA